MSGERGFLYAVLTFRAAPEVRLGGSDHRFAPGEVARRWCSHEGSRELGSPVAGRGRPPPHPKDADDDPPHHALCARAAHPRAAACWPPSQSPCRCSRPLPLAATPAHANNPAGPHDPIGVLETVVANRGGSYTLNGWAADPDALTSQRHRAACSSTVRSAARSSPPSRVPASSSRHHTGPTPGFTTTVSPGSGVHTVCVAASQRAAGPADRAALLHHAAGLGGHRQPRPAGPGHLHRRLREHDDRERARRRSRLLCEPPVAVVLYVDGSPAKTVDTHWGKTRTGTKRQPLRDHACRSRPDRTSAASGSSTSASGRTASLGCNAADTRGTAGTRRGRRRRR